VLRAAQVVIEEKFARPILIGRPGVIERRWKSQAAYPAGGRFRSRQSGVGRAFRECWTAYHKLMARRGVTPAIAKERCAASQRIIGAMLLKLGYADGLICGMTGQFSITLGVIRDLIGKRSDGVHTLAAMNYLMLPGRSLFICDTHVNENPSAQEIAEMTLMAAEQVKRFGIQPKVALLSHSNFGSSNSESARKMSRAATPWLTPCRPVNWKLTAKCTATPRCPRNSSRSQPRLAAQGRGQPAGHAEHRRRQHLLQPDQDDRWRRRDHRPHPARRGARCMC
jgi:malate dehydrogenase (oxaloacetate-decarboxylating)(NADP+)